MVHYEASLSSLSVYDIFPFGNSVEKDKLKQLDKTYLHILFDHQLCIYWLKGLWLQI